MLNRDDHMGKISSSLDEDGEADDSFYVDEHELMIEFEAESFSPISPLLTLSQFLIISCIPIHILSCLTDSSRRRDYRHGKMKT